MSGTAAKIAFKSLRKYFKDKKIFSEKQRKKKLKMRLGGKSSQGDASDKHLGLRGKLPDRYTSPTGTPIGMSPSQLGPRYSSPLKITKKKKK